MNNKYCFVSFYIHTAPCEQQRSMKLILQVFFFHCFSLIYVWKSRNISNIYNIKSYQCFWHTFLQIPWPLKLVTWTFNHLDSLLLDTFTESIFTLFISGRPLKESWQITSAQDCYFTSLAYNTDSIIPNLSDTLSHHYHTITSTAQKTFTIISNMYHKPL